ncbi:hypothetical protein RND81_11G229700 [Saponaria officinalis]|uniref:Uncharacterized protein n=1 Tax=Saponaria officinalis TaxID=3572 RepID=A0AAW1HQT6_SAPOF
MAIFEIACEEDIILNKESKPCINKLKFLQLLIQILSKKYLQKVFINHGIFTLLKNWLEFLPDGSLPNFNVRQTILEILTHKSRDIYNISTRFEDARSTHNETINKRPCIRKPIKKAPVAKDDDFELEIYEFSSGHKKRSNSYFKSRAQIPEATSMTFVVSPPSKVDKNQSVAENKHHNNIVKTLRKMKTAKHARQIAKFAY